MSLEQDPVLVRRRLGQQLRQARETAGRTQSEVAGELYWSVSKIVRIERGQVATQPTDVRALATACSISDPAAVDALIAMALAGRRQGWNEYKDIFQKPYLTYLAYESSASVVRHIHATLVPGLLQHEAYAREILTQIHQNPEERIQRIIEVRLQRQELLVGKEGPEFRFIIDESALRRPIGGAATMRAQFKRLQEVLAYPRVHVSVLPVAVGAHLGLLGPFILLEFKDPQLTSMIFSENPLGDSVLRDDDETTSKYLDEFERLEKLALSGDAVNEFLDTLISEPPGQ